MSCFKLHGTHVRGDLLTVVLCGVTSSISFPGRERRYFTLHVFLKRGNYCLMYKLDHSDACNRDTHT